MEGHAHGDGDCTCDPGSHHPQDSNGLVKDFIAIYDEQGMGNQAKLFFLTILQFLRLKLLFQHRKIRITKRTS